MKRALLVLAVSAAALVAASPVWADNFSQGTNTSVAAKWKVYGINPSGRAYGKGAVSNMSSGIGFAFQAMDPAVLGTGASLMLTDHPGSDLLGDLTGKTITATFTITGQNPVFTYDRAPGACGTPASARLYFEGDTSNGPFQSNYWWSNPASATLASVVGNQVTLTVPLDPALWSDYNGQYGASVPAEFGAAVADVTGIGLSFGGGCFFANGVGLASGSASFVLSDYSIS